MDKSISSNSFVSYYYTDSLVIKCTVLAAIANLKDTASYSGAWASQTIRMFSDQAMVWKLDLEGVHQTVTNITTWFITY